MKPHTRISSRLLLTVFLVAAGAPSPRAQTEPLRLTLRDAIRTALRGNLALRAQAYDPLVAAADAAGSYGIYDRTATGSLQANDEETPSPAKASDGARRKVLSTEAGISQLFPSGGKLLFAFDNSYADAGSGSGGSFLREYFQSSLTVNITQPLIKNFGRDMTELGIVVARNGQEASLETFRAKLSDTVAQVRAAYFRLQALGAVLDARQTSLSVARRVLEDTKGRVKAGMLPAMEILNAEFGVASREKDVIEAGRAVRDQTDVLALLLQLEGNPEILAVDVPRKDPHPVEESEAVTRALEQRFDLRAQRVAVKTGLLQVNAAENRLRPDLSLVASAGLAGIDRDYADNLEKLSRMDYPVWGIGVRFSFPLGNTAAQNDYVRNKLLVEQSRAQIRSQEASVRNEVRAAIRGIEANFKQLEVTGRGRAYAEETLRAYLKKNEVGMATTKDVLDVESSLVGAKTAEIQAWSDYENAITALWQSTGEILEREGVSIADAAPEALAPGGAEDAFTPPSRQ